MIFRESKNVESIGVFMDHFKLVSEYKPTGSDKTFTMANIMQVLNKPTLVIAHNRNLVRQLYGEFKDFFPENVVEYFVS